MSEDRTNAEIIADLHRFWLGTGDVDLKIVLEASDRLSSQSIDLLYKDEVIEMLQLKIGMVEDPERGRT